jgi:N4-gp56 family major capsid protein
MPSTLSTAVGVGGTKGGVVLPGAVRDVYSQEILLQAQPSLVFAQFVDRRTELNREPGDTIKFTKYNDLQGATKLSEVEYIQTTHLSSSQIQIQVDEHGFAVSESERLIRTAWDDVVARATMLLGQHYGRTVDALLRDEFLAAAALQTFFPGTVANRAAMTSADTLSVKAIKDAVEKLAVNKTPKIGGNYVGVVHPHQSRGLRDDSDWLDAHKYAAPAEIFRGEIGMIEGVRFIETTNTTVIKTNGDVYADNTDTGRNEAIFAAVDVYQALILGANAVGWAEALPVQFRDGGLIDFGRTRQLAWYSIMGAGKIRAENVAGIETA